MTLASSISTPRLARDTELVAQLSSGGLKTAGSSKVGGSRAGTVVSLPFVFLSVVLLSVAPRF